MGKLKDAQGQRSQMMGLDLGRLWLAQGFDSNTAAIAGLTKFHGRPSSSALDKAQRIGCVFKAQLVRYDANWRRRVNDATARFTSEAFMNDFQRTLPSQSKSY